MGKLKNAEKAEDKTDLIANMRAVPDGGWDIIILGIQNNLGLFHVEHLEDFKKSKLETGIASFYFAIIPRGFYIFICTGISIFSVCHVFFAFIYHGKFE